MLFVTNNATKSRKSYKTKFDKLGVEAHVVSVHLLISDARGETDVVCVGRDLWISLRCRCVHFLRPKATEGQESLCDRYDWYRGRAEGRGHFIHRWNCTSPCKPCHPKAILNSTDHHTIHSCRTQQTTPSNRSAYPTSLPIPPSEPYSAVSTPPSTIPNSPKLSNTYFETPIVPSLQLMRIALIPPRMVCFRVQDRLVRR